MAVSFDMVDDESYRPKYCPICGKRFKDDKLSVMLVYSESEGNYVYDCYCPECKWSGEISPDKKDWKKRI